MSDGRDLICTFDGTFDGFLSVMHYVIKNRVRPVRICDAADVQTVLNTDILFIPTDNANAETVRQSAMDTMGYEGFKRAYCTFLNSSPESCMTSYYYLLYGFKYGKNTHHYMSVDYINNAYKLERQVMHEVDRMQGLLRFSVMDGGVEYAPMEPQHDILALIMPHFAQRLKTIPFVIHDLLRQKAGVCKNGTWFITDAEDLVPPKMSQDEKMYRDLWKSFYKAICIRERTNHKLQTQMLPKKYRNHLTEFQL